MRLDPLLESGLLGESGQQLADAGFRAWADASADDEGSFLEPFVQQAVAAEHVAQSGQYF